MDLVCLIITSEIRLNIAAIICIKIFHLEITKLHICWFDKTSISNLIS